MLCCIERTLNSDEILLPRLGEYGQYMDIIFSSLMIRTILCGALYPLLSFIQATESPLVVTTIKIPSRGLFFKTENKTRNYCKLDISPSNSGFQALLQAFIQTLCNNVQTTITYPVCLPTAGKQRETFLISCL